jgi:ABC-type uncharacterized transport system substrate-binding protein
MKQQTVSSRAHLLFSVVLFIAGLVLTACTPATPAAAPTAQPTTSQTAVPAANYAGKKIVFINSYHEGYEWSDGVERGIHNVLDGTGAEVKFIRLDTKRNQDVEFGKKAGEQAKAELDAFKPDVIIACDDNAQKYVIVPYYKDTAMPVVFAAVNWDASIYGYPTSNVTGMVEVELPGQIVEQLKPYAKGNRIGFISIDESTEQKTAKTYNDRFFNGQMKTYWATTMDEFKAAFLKAQDEVDMLFMNNNAGAKQWDPVEMEKFILANTKIPAGTINSWMAPYSLLALTKVPEEQGEWSAQTALRIMDGTPVSSIPVVENKKGGLTLNLSMAEKMGIVFPPSMLKNAETYTVKQ